MPTEIRALARVRLALTDDLRKPSACRKGGAVSCPLTILNFELTSSPHTHSFRVLILSNSHCQTR